MAKTSPTKKKTVLAEPKAEPVYPAFKYFELFAPDVHRYTQAYVVGGFRDILKTKAEWDGVMKSVTEGKQ